MTFLKFLLIGLVCYKAEAKFVYPRFDEINMARTLDERLGKMYPVLCNIRILTKNNLHYKTDF